VAANLLIPPVTITPDGRQAMLDFGRALATRQAVFTFPLATRMEDPPVAAP
jgi:hypothetical protein